MVLVLGPMVSSHVCLLFLFIQRLSICDLSSRMHKNHAANAIGKIFMNEQLHSKSAQKLCTVYTVLVQSKQQLKCFCVVAVCTSVGLDYTQTQTVLGYT